MTQIGNQRHTRTGSKRLINITTTSFSEKCLGFFKTALEITVIAFMILTVALFMAVAFDRYAPAIAAAGGNDDHHFAGKGKRFTRDVPVSPPPSSPPPEMQLRGSGKRESSDKSESRVNDLKARLSLLEQKRAADFAGIVQGADAALKAAQAAEEAEMAAIAAVAEAIATTPAGVPWGRGAWDVSIMEKNALKNV